MNYEELEFSEKGAAQNELRARTQSRNSDMSVHVNFFCSSYRNTFACGYGFSDWVSKWRVVANLAAKCDCDTEKSWVSVLRYGIIRAIVYQDVSVCLGKLCLPAASGSVVMVGSAAWILHKACFTVVPNLQSDLHQNSCRGWVKIAWAYFLIYIYNSVFVCFFFFLNGGRGTKQMQLRFRCVLNHSLSSHHWALFQRIEWLSQISLWYIWNMWWFS